MPSAVAALAACAAVAAGSAASVPVYIWGTSARSASSGVQRKQHADVAELRALVKDATEVAAGAGSHTISLFTFDDLLSADIAPLSARQGSGGAMALLAHALSSAPYGYSVREVDVAASVLVEALPAKCKVVRVAAQGAAAGQAELSRQTYEELISSPSEGCTAFVVPLLRSHLDAEMAFAARASARAAQAGPAVSILTSEGGEAATGAPRLLAASATAAPSATNSTGVLYMTPPILEGLLISLVLIFFLAVGLSCVMSIQTPDQLFATTDALPAGKEY